MRQAPSEYKTMSHLNYCIQVVWRLSTEAWKFGHVRDNNIKPRACMAKGCMDINKNTVGEIKN